MHALHPALLTELAHSHIDDRVRTASRASVRRRVRDSSDRPLPRVFRLLA